MRKPKPPKKKSARRPVRSRPAARRATTSGKVHDLIHELQVHAEEITVQNEQLLRAQGDLEDARDRFADLYDFAPTGYLSVDQRGGITEVNLAGSALLGRPRAFLIRLPLSALVRREDRDRLNRFLVEARGATHGPAPTVEVAARADQRTLRMAARPGAVGRQTDLFIAVVDATEERRLERELRDALAREQTRGVELVREVKERLAAEHRVKALLEKLVTAQEEERRRIARNLHDHLGQQLTALKLTLDSLKESAGVSAELHKRLTIAEEIVTRLDHDVDLLAWDLRPVTLDLGLTSALTDLVRQWSAVTDIPAELHQSTPAELRLGAKAEPNVYRIVQEALNNIAKHADATSVSVLLESRPGEAMVIIEDNGRGFDPELAAKSQSEHSGMGLVGMRERAAIFDGTVQVESAPGQGTTIFVRIPIKAVSEAPA
jgi:PAS domain S-box-containing protein